jgi:hypothetical protein
VLKNIKLQICKSFLLLNAFMANMTSQMSQVLEDAREYAAMDKGNIRTLVVNTG